MKIHATFPENEIDPRESRLIFIDANAGGETDQTTENAEADYRPDVEDWKNESYAAYEKHLIEAQRLGKVEAADVPGMLAHAKRQFEKWKREKREATSTSAETIKKKIEDARKIRSDKKLIAKTVDAVKEGFLTDVAEIRKFVRQEINSFLTIEADDIADFQDQAFEEFLDFETEILDSITALLKDKDYAAIQQSIERDKQRAKECYRKLREIFHDEKKRKFLELLSDTKGIPAMEKMQIKSLSALASRMEGRWEKSESLIGIVDGGELSQLEQALDAIKMIFEKWEKIKDKDIKSRDALLSEFFEYEKRLESFAVDMRENPPRGIESAPFIEIWPDHFQRRRNDAIKLKELINADKSKSNLRIAQAFLEGSTKELKDLEDERARIGARERIAEKDEPKKTEKLPDKRSTSTPDLGMKGATGHEKSNAINDFGKAFFGFVTAHGRIQWYSFHDISETFKLIGKSWAKHTESYTEDKSGALAKELMFWKQEVKRRVHETDLIAEKGRADERKKRYKNLSYEELVAELCDLPPRDKRRAILETLAERGNLRMSDHRLINKVTNNSITEEQWIYADSTCDYIEIIRKFKEKIDHYFLDEVGYGQQLIDMQTSGQANKESLGEKLGDHSITGSPAAESAMVAVQIDNAGLEGDNVVTGLIKKGFGRGNKHTDNGQMTTMKMRTESSDEAIIRDNATAGLDALKIVDGYLKGLLSGQTIQGLSKKNEAGYTPYAAFQDVLITKDKRDPSDKSRAISSFELWGWIRDGKITNLGRRQIINFFDGRVAFDGENNIIYIADNSGTYARHSTKYTSISDFRGLGIPVADKMRTACVKAGGVEIYDNATQRANDKNQIVGTQQEVTFLIKAACEEIEDGVTMVRYGQTDMKKKGQVRLEKGTKALEIMFGNIVKNTEDRDIFTRADGNPAYGIMYRKKDINNKTTYGEIADETKVNKNLIEFLEYYLINLAHLDQFSPSHYNRVMRAYNNLTDKSKILSRELRDAKNSADKQEMQRHFGKAA
ncbi:MAG: hypothetical protein WCV72_02775 [Patescibacteria group bacterium]